MEPLTIEEILHDTLTEEQLQRAVGTRHLEDVSQLELVIDSSKMSIEGIWGKLPSLHCLVLDGSTLVSFRDLGVSLRHLHTLSLAGSSIEDLDGIAALSGLRELRLPRNQLVDLTPIACHESLQVL
ncbi:unnamed protein product, partial [Discosporangium mesarthrocarpum]